MRTHVSADLGRFLIAGVANTALTTAIYFLGLIVLSPAVSYAVAWLIGIVFVTSIYPDRVFVGSSVSKSRRAVLGLTVVAVFFAGEVVLSLVVAATHHPSVAFAIALAFTFVLNFGLSRFIMRTARGRR